MSARTVYSAAIANINTVSFVVNDLKGSCDFRITLNKQVKNFFINHFNIPYLYRIAKVRGSLKQENEKLLSENKTIKSKKLELEKELFMAKSEIETLKSEIVRYDLNAQMLRTDVSSKKVELEKEFLMKAHQIDNETHKKIETAEEKAVRLAKENNFAHADTVAVTRQLKVAQRKVAQLEEILRENQNQEARQSEDNRKMAAQIDEMRSYYRNKLTLAMNQGGDERLRMAKDELILTYKEREAELFDKYNTELTRNNQNLKIIRGLRVYCRNLKNLAED